MDDKLTAALSELFKMKSPSIAKILRSREYNYEAELFEKAMAEWEKHKTKLS